MARPDGLKATLAELKRDYPNISEDVLKVNTELAAADNVDPAKFLQAQRLIANKFHAQRTGRYPSKKHARYADDLWMQMQGGAIKGWIEEVPFRLPGDVVHRVDFGIIHLDDRLELVEVKGKDLREGKNKRKQVEDLYSVKIKVV